ncbi:MAG TPA: 50S ribosomal protein L20 [Candidatus Peribacteraceae bacterium]|nr:50S ribosomal protein L20 [Candidatus Peribacteraceae bacterium]
MRVKRGTVRHKKHKKIRKLAKGYHGGRKNTAKAKEAIIKAGQHAYMDRRKKKRNFRSLWIVRLNAAIREAGGKYSVFIDQLKKKNIQLDRKVLSELAIREPEAFKKIVEQVTK